MGNSSKGSHVSAQTDKFDDGWLTNHSVTVFTNHGRQALKL
jgi:hypothetical protein